MARARRTTSSYLGAVRANAQLVPSLRKYRRRKKLTRWEKAAITRAENKVRTAGGNAGILHPITEKQYRSLKDKSIIVGNGVRAVRLRGIGPRSSVSVKDGEVVVKSGKRTWRFRRVTPFPSDVVEKAESAFKRGAKAVDLWLVQGRLGRAASNIQLFAEIVAEFFNQYDETDGFDDWFEGIAFYR